MPVACKGCYVPSIPSELQERRSLPGCIWARDQHGPSFVSRSYTGSVAPVSFDGWNFKSLPPPERSPNFPCPASRAIIRFLLFLQLESIDLTEWLAIKWFFSEWSWGNWLELVSCVLWSQVLPTFLWSIIAYNFKIFIFCFPLNKLQLQEVVGGALTSLFLYHSSHFIAAIKMRFFFFCGCGAVT